MQSNPDVVSVLNGRSSFVVASTQATNAAPTTAQHLVGPADQRWTDGRTAPSFTNNLNGMRSGHFVFVVERRTRSRLVPTSFVRVLRRFQST